MSGFLQKVRTLTLGTAHDLVDKAIDMNSPSMLRQYVRDLEDALDKMHNEAAVQAGTLRTMDREKTDVTQRLATKTNKIKEILAGSAANRTEMARLIGTDVVSLQKRLDELTTSYSAQQKTSAQIDSAVTNLESKHGAMVERLRELERIDMDSKVKESAAASLNAAGKLVAGGADMSVDDIESKMRARNDIASEKMDRAMGSVQTQDDPETAAAVDDLLAKLQQPVSKSA